MNLFKQKNWRNKQYTDWVKAQSCMITDYPACDPHHIKGHGMTGGTKAPDWAVIPLSQSTHKNLHHKGYKQWEAEHGSQLEYLFKFIHDNWEEIQTFFAMESD